MATYEFTSITSAQANAYEAGNDDLAFDGLPGAKATDFSVELSVDRYVIHDLSTGAGVTLGAGADGDVLHLPDGSVLSLPSVSPVDLVGGDGGDHLVGGSSLDQLSGLGGDDWLEGGAGADTLIGGTGPDTLSGGGGNDFDVFVFASRDSGVTEGKIDVITDWRSQDKIELESFLDHTKYAEYFASSYSEALQRANQQISAHAASIVSVQVGSDVVVFSDTHNDGGSAEDAILLKGASLNDISSANFETAAPAPTPTPTPDPTPTPNPTPNPIPMPDLPNEPVLPRWSGYGPSEARGEIGGDMDKAHLSYALDAIIREASDTHVSASIGDVYLTLDGSGFAVDDSGHLAGGVASEVYYAYGADHGGPFTFSMATPPVSLFSLANWALQDQTQTFFSEILAGNDDLHGELGQNDLIRGFAGDDLITGWGGNDTLWGGSGDDQIFALDQVGDYAEYSGSTYLRGEDGNDYIVGGRGFDDINGNQGNDTASGGAGDDWVVGGKDNDLLFGDAGNDLVYGNLGNDTCEGGDGNDIVRGGQGDDLIFGDKGDDFISGDKGDDTLVGGSGADIFHTFGDAGIDRVLDFNSSEGDRVMLDPGTHYTVAQVGADTVISMTGGAQMILVGVQLSSLPQGWIFGA